MKFWDYLLAKLRDKQNVYLLTVVENSGSSPGRRGFKMLVAEDGFIFGSIGGGVMEFSLVEEVKKLLRNGELKIFLKKQIHRRSKENGSGMICSGEQTVVFHPLQDKHISMIEKLLDFSQDNTRGILVLKSFSVNVSSEKLNDQFDFEINSSTDWVYRENIGVQNTLYIVGGGHVSVAVSGLFVSLGFHVVVFDDRENLNTLEMNTSANQKLIVDFNDIADHIPEGPGSYIAIMTNRYTDDKLVLTRIIRNNYAYVGVLGSIAKLKTLWKELEKDGFSKSSIDGIHGPIGLSIKSQTPQEIAVSIAAEVIMIKNRKQ